MGTTLSSIPLMGADLEGVSQSNFFRLWLEICSGMGGPCVSSFSLLLEEISTGLALISWRVRIAGLCKLHHKAGDTPAGLASQPLFTGWRPPYTLFLREHGFIEGTITVTSFWLHGVWSLLKEYPSNRPTHLTIIFWQIPDVRLRVHPLSGNQSEDA